MEHKIQNCLPTDSIDDNTDTIMTKTIYLNGELFRNDRIIEINIS